MRIIKRYSNRKLYDPANHNYITLAELAVLVRENVDFQVQDYVTMADLTGRTLAQIIFVEAHDGRSDVPRASEETLLKIIRTGIIP